MTVASHLHCSGPVAGTPEPTDSGVVLAKADERPNLQQGDILEQRGEEHPCHLLCPLSPATAKLELALLQDRQVKLSQLK